MSKNYLILGCSYSAGSHIYSKGSVNDEELNTRTGWYSYVDWLKNYNVTVFSCPGQGYASWLQILDSLVITKKIKKYDKIIIQETNEPRITFLEPKELEINIRKDFLIESEQIENIKHIIFNPFNLNHEDNMKPNVIRCFKLNEKTLQRYSPLEEHKKLLFNQDILFYSKGFLSQIIAERCAELVQDICKKHNISGYVWSMGDPVMKCDHLTRLPLCGVGKTLIKLKMRTQSLVKYQEIIRTFKFKSFLKTEVVPVENKRVGHQTEEGNKFIGKNIHEMLCNEN